MAYTKTAWVNGSQPAINADNLNKIEQGIFDSHEAIEFNVWTTKTSNTTAVSGDRFFCDTSSSAFTITLPASPSNGDKVRLIDVKSTFNVNNLFVDPNGKTIRLISGTITLAKNNTDITFVFSADANTWLYFNSEKEFIQKSSTYTAKEGDEILADTGSSAFTITLPANPTTNASVTIIDSAGNFATNNITVDRNGSNIRGAASNLSLSTNWQIITFIYVSPSVGWMYAAIPTGGGGGGLSTWQIKTSNYTAVNGDRLLIDTSSIVTITLPASPTVGDEVWVKDCIGNASSNYIAFNYNSEYLRGAVGSKIISTNWAGLHFIYTGAVYGWTYIEINTGGGGGGGLSAWEYKYSHFTAASSGRYLIDTSVSIIITLPSSPSNGDEVWIYDQYGSASSNNITVNPSGYDTINGSSTAYLNTNYGQWHLVFYNGGWVYNGPGGA